MSIKQRLELFIEMVDELTERKLLKKGLKSSLTIFSHEDKGWKIEISWPDEDDLRSYLTSFRHFILKNSPVFLNRIYKLCIKHVKDSKVKQMLERNRKHWLDIHKQGAMGLVYQGKKLTPKYVVDLFIKGKIFHIEGEERAFLKGIPDFQDKLFKHQFIDFLVLANKHIFFLDSVIKKVVNENLLIDDSANT